MHRLQVVLGHLAGRPESSSALQAAPCSARFPQASASDVVVVHGRRTPIGRASRGGFKNTTPDELLSAVLTAVLQDVRLKPEQLGDISVGELPCGSCTGPPPPSSRSFTFSPRTWVSLSKTTDSTDLSGMVEGPFYRVRLRSSENTNIYITILNSSGITVLM